MTIDDLAAGAVSTGDPVAQGKAVELRQQGQSFAAIADTLGYHRAGEAQRAFLLGLRRLPTGDQAVVRRDESGRLDRLEQRLRAGTRLSETERGARLEVLGHLRRAVMKDAQHPDAGAPGSP